MKGRVTRWGLRRIDAPDGDLLFDGMETNDHGNWVRFEDLTALKAKCDRQEAALRELAALVRGECPALLDDDRGGNSALALELEELEQQP